MRPIVLACLLLLTLLTSCRESDAGETDGPSPDYLISHTSGTIGRASAIVATVDETVDLGNPEAVSLEFTPAIAGERSVRGRQLVYTPAEPLPAATTFTASLRLGDRPVYRFTFATPERRLALESEGYYLPDGNRPEHIEVRGRVITNDGGTVEEIAEVLRVEYRGQPLPVEITRMAPNVFRYVARIEDRGSEPSVVRVSTEAGVGGFAGAAQSLDIRVAPTGTFELVGVDPATEGNGLVARFTSAVDGDQELTGLVRFDPELDFTSSVDGNLIQLYPSVTADAGREATIYFDPQLLAADGQPLNTAVSWRVSLGRTEPGLRQVGNGTILPHEGRRLYTFEAIGLEAVYLELFRIDGGNVLQFLQDNELGSVSQDWNLRRVGHTVERTEVALADLAASANRDQWSRYAIDLGPYLDNDGEGAVYQVRLGFGLEHTVQGCGARVMNQLALPTIGDRLAREDGFSVGFPRVNSLISDYSGLYGYQYWDDRDDPCSPAFYQRERFLLQNLLSSNLGLIAKRNPDRSTIVFTTDLLTGGPAGGVNVTAYSYDRLPLGKGRTDTEGKLTLETDREPAFLVATEGADYAYLRVTDGDALPLGRFDVAGASARGGVSGAFFAERGVWRPGDTVFLNFVLADRDGRLPDAYPIQFELRDARGTTVERRTVRPFAGSLLYPLTFTTGRTDGTGSWTASVLVGGEEYTRSLLIESVKPNRLAIDVNAADDGRGIALAARWLYGAPASGLRATVTGRPRQRRFTDPDLRAFVFQDPARVARDAAELPLFDGSLDAEGTTVARLPLASSNAAGPLQFRLVTKVFEPGGNFSIDNSTVPYDPFTTYVGVRLPTGKWGGKQLSTEGESTVDLLTVGADGQPVGSRKLSVGIYRVDYRYWWQDGNDNVARFSSNLHTEAIQTMNVTTAADGTARLPVEIDRYGRYLIRACDGGGHCTGDYFYAGYGEPVADDRQSAALLNLTASTAEAGIGEEVSVRVPTSEGGQLLVSLETASGSIEQFWVPAQRGETTVRFTTDSRMVPTVYANVSYLQPFAQTVNDRPVRLFGIVPVAVTDPATRLEPVVTTAEEWKPRERVEVSVSERNGKPMTYVLTVVDEGLLGLTRFATPDLHGEFFAKQALAVATYDVYDEVMSSINGAFGKVLAIGGDGTVVNPEEASANRFVPVVRHLGPFRLEQGTVRHSIEMPNYLGAVRVMAVAVSEGAYGSSEATVAVRQPLMVLPTLPRQLGPGEEVDMPVNVMKMDGAAGQVGLAVSTEGGLLELPSATTTLDFERAGDRLTYLPLRVGQRTGVARIEVAAAGGGHRSTQEVEIDVRYQNVPATRTQVYAIPPGKERAIDYAAFGLPGTRTATVELSSLPALNLGHHLRSLSNYPYGCLEQTVATSFTQLYLDRLTELTPEREAERRRFVMSGIASLQRFRTGGGGLSYWPGRYTANPWANSFALHFLLLAEREGYAVPQGLREELITFQATAARGWSATAGDFYVSPQQRYRDQVYRLYTLALAGRTDAGAMNRLRARATELPVASRYQLAAAYAISGRGEVATQLISGAERKVTNYRELGYTFGSRLRDMGIILQSLNELGDRASADRQAFRVATAVGERSWLSTQEAAFAFLSLSGAVSAASGPISGDFTSPTGATSRVGANTGIQSIELPTEDAADFTVANTGSATLYVSLVTEGIPAAGRERTESSNLRLTVSFTDLNGRSLDVTSLPSGTEFYASYRVTNPGTTGQDYRQLALASLLPSGWEVANERLSGADASSGQFTYQDFRDDRVNTFFDLPRGESMVFRFRMTATYPGRYYLPTQLSEAMYDRDIRAEVRGRWITVTRSN